jgi:Lrp/AsnC family leucine-responsive transcriptional regulator
MFKRKGVFSLGKHTFFIFGKGVLIMDNIDRKIIKLLQGNARTPLKYLANKVFLSSPAVSARIERLEKSGIITGYHASVDNEALGYHITAFIHMALDPKQKPTFYPFVEACPNVLECNCVTGAHSMLMKVCFQSTSELDSFIGQLQRFGSTETQIVFSTPVPTRGISIDTDSLDSEAI